MGETGLVFRVETGTLHREDPLSCKWTRTMTALVSNPSEQEPKSQEAYKIEVVVASYIISFSKNRWLFSRFSSFFFAD